MSQLTRLAARLTPSARIQQHVTAISRHTFGRHIARSAAPPAKRGASTLHWTNSNTRTSGVPRGDVQTPPPEIPKALQNRAKLNPIVKLLKIAEFRTPTPQDIRKKGSKVLKLLFYISNDK